MKPEDEVSLQVIDGNRRRGMTGREGMSDHVEIGMRESGRPRAEEVEAKWVVS